MLRGLGISVTHQRLGVLRYLLANHPHHPSAEDVYLGLRGLEPPLSRASVYNILRLFEEKGLLVTLSIDPRTLRYDLAADRHGHFQRDRCGCIVDFGVPVDSLPISGLGGFEIRHRDIFFKGLCPKCVKARDAEHDAGDDAEDEEIEEPAIG